jgi:hypothetical protein
LVGHFQRDRWCFGLRLEPKSQQESALSPRQRSRPLMPTASISLSLQVNSFERDQTTVSKTAVLLSMSESGREASTELLEQERQLAGCSSIVAGPRIDISSAQPSPGHALGKLRKCDGRTNDSPIEVARLGVVTFLSDVQTGC